MSSKERKSLKATKREALARLRASRNEGGVGRLDAMEFEEEDVYEAMDEERYREYVERRREREDFVVDDDGLGYHDDGDYDITGLADESDHANASTKKKGGNNALTREALKKARKNRAAAAAASSEGGDGGSGGGKGKTMWDFVNKGASVSAAGANDAGSSHVGERRAAANKGSVGGARNDAVSEELDDMLAELDDAPAAPSSGRRGRSSVGRRSLRGPVAASSSRRRSASRGGDAGCREVGPRKRRAFGSRQPAPSRRRGGRASLAPRDRGERTTRDLDDRDRDDLYADDDDANFGGDGNDVDFGDDEEVGEGAFISQDDVGAEDDGVEENAKASDTKAREDDDEMEDMDKKVQDDLKKEADNSVAEKHGKEEEATEAALAKSSRPRTGRLAGRLSALAAKRAKEEAEKKAKELAERRLAEQKEEEERKEKGAAVAASSANKSTDGGAEEMSLDTSSTSFQPSAIAAATATHELGVGSSSMNLERIVQVEEESEALEDDKEDKESAAEPRSYLDLYWLDASERKGVVSLYGKVKVPVESKEALKNKGRQEFVYQSCCVTIPGNERNLFVLPRLMSTETDEFVDEEEGQPRERHPIGDVYAEMKKVLQPSCIPHTTGASWKAKPVTRSYAFEDPSIPRGECQYLKVVYDGRYDVPDRQICINGGKTFEKILGAGASNLENFLIKRRLMGPGWVRIYGPRPMAGGNASWCRWECTVDGPKSIKKLDLISTASGEKIVVPPAPPVSTTSIKFKTAVNPKSQKLEIVCVSAVCHAHVLLDGASDQSTKHMTQLTLVRPLNFETQGAMAQFPRDMEKEVRKGMPDLQKCPNERALLSRLFAQLGTWDPDVLVSHNGWGHDIDVLLSRCVELKVSMWSKIGRRRQMTLPKQKHFGSGNDWAIASALDGRILCDTYVSAKEFLSRETTYSLTNLANTQLKMERAEIESVDVPRWCRTGEHLVSLARHTLNDAQLVQGLMFKLQALPLTKQLTNIAGNLWSRTMKGNRAERNEYLLLHEFHRLKYIVPEKRSKKQRDEDLFGDSEEGGAGPSAGKNKSKYSGGLVLDPKKGLYDSFILLLDFNSLYPSLIQEYNLCFTTMAWAKSNAPSSDGEDGAVAVQGDVLPSLPGDDVEKGVLPRVIKTLVDRRRNVKKLMKGEKDADKKEELDIRQMALKLTANSMYGCLGFSHSRFFAQPIAALVTAMGRETLQRTVDLAQTTVGLEVIYGDTDSIMINTRITDLKDFPQVLELGNRVKREVNRLYRTLELEIDGIFRSMLLLKKKKYAAVTISEGPNGTFIMGKEMKGLDLVRRDWCIQSKESGRFVLDRILSGEEREVVVEGIHDHMEEVAQQMRGGELPLEKYVITKGLNKHPNDYPDAKSLFHVHVAKRMLMEHKAVSVGDHIPYVVCEETVEEKEQQQMSNAKKATPAERARHPDEIKRSGGVLKPDVEWYLAQQILPPISRLCEPIEGTSQGILAEKLGLDSTKYNSAIVSGAAAYDEDDEMDYTPASCLPDDERFKDVQRLAVMCAGCSEESEFPGAFRLVKDMETGAQACLSGLRCPNSLCPRPDNWGEPDPWSCVAKILNRVNRVKREHQRRYYDALVRCDDPMCSLETRQLSVVEGCCLKVGCNGRMKSAYTESAMQTQLKYFDSLFDVAHACKQLLGKSVAGVHPTPLTEKEVMKSLAVEDKEPCINAEAGELRAFEYIISAYPSGSELQAMTRQYLLQYTSRIIAESQPRYRHPLMEKNLPSTEHGMDSELNGVLGLLARTDVLPTLLQDQSFQAVCRLRLSRQNRLTALQSTYPTLHYGILAILASGEMTGFLIEGNQELLVFLNAVQLKILWSMLVGTFTSCFMVFYDLLNPFSGCYQVTAAVDQLQTIRLGLKAQTQLSLLDYDAIKRPLPVVNGEAEVPSKATPTPKVENTTEGKESVHAVAQKVNGSSAQASIPVEEKSPEKVNESAAQKPIPVDDKVPEKINGSTAQTPLLVEGDAAENVNGSAARKDFPVEEKVPDEVNGSTASKPLLVEGKAAEKINGAAVRKPFPADGKVPEKANGSTAPKPLLVEGKAAEKANGSAVRKPFLVDENVPEKVNGSSASTKPLFVEGKAAEKVNGSAVRKDFPLEGKIPEKVNGSTAPKPLLVEGKAAEKLNGSTAPNPLPVDDKVPEKVKEASIQKPRYYF